MLLILLPLLSTLLSPASAAGYQIISSASHLPTTSFDYLIAGGGLTGLVVANKLSAAGNTVLVVEAGPNPIDFDSVNNAELRGSITAEQCNWKYTAYDDDLSPLSTLVDAGRCLGGSTSINGMVFYRPTLAEFDALESLGNTGWNSQTLLPYLVETERFNPPDASQLADNVTYDPASRPTTGNTNTSFSHPIRNPAMVATYHEAFQDVYPGIPVSTDLSKRNGSVLSNTIWSIFWDPVNQINRRSSAAWSYLFNETPQTLPGTLTVLVQNRVARVNLDSTKTAVGFEIQNSKGAATVKVTAKKEVILAAGALQSAPLLERSGIGSKQVLTQLGVTKQVILEGVGKGLNDQPGTGLAALVTDAVANNTEYIDGVNIFAPIIALPGLAEMFPNADGPLKVLLQATLDIRALDMVANGGFANLEGARKVLGALTDLIVNKKQPIAEIVGEAYPGGLAYPIFWPLMPYSRGHVHANSTDPFDNPIIVPRFLTDYFDQLIAVTVSIKSRALFKTSAFQPLISQLYVDGLGVSQADDNNYEAWLEWYKSTSYGASHWIGSTSMLPQSSGGVVNPKLQVYGTKNLRIVDAGVLPLQSTAHTQPYVYTLALRAADIILGN
ncbi:GMC oxidoreductase [Atractiella rhizophila]|nr:GMC oxidoreductase [Atractiella rhizophila]